MIPELEAHRILARNSEVLSAEISGELALMSVQNGKYYALNATASVIWRALEQPIPLSGLTAALTARYNGDPAQIEADLRETLQEWLVQRLITVAAPDLRDFR